MYSHRINNGILAGLLVFFTALAFAFGVFWLDTQTEIDKTNKQLQKLERALLELPFKRNESNQALARAYRNDELGFAFQYPESWLEERLFKAKSRGGADSAHPLAYVAVGVIDCSANIYLPDSIYLNEYLKKNAQTLRAGPVVFLVSFSTLGFNNDQQEQCESRFEPIFKTIRYVGDLPAIDSAAWPLHQNKLVGFSFKAPADWYNAKNMKATFPLTLEIFGYEQAPEQALVYPPDQLFTKARLDRLRQDIEAGKASGVITFPTKKAQYLVLYNRDRDSFFQALQFFKDKDLIRLSLALPVKKADDTGISNILASLSGRDAQKEVIQAMDRFDELLGTLEFYAADPFFVDNEKMKDYLVTVYERSQDLPDVPNFQGMFELSSMMFDPDETNLPDAFVILVEKGDGFTHLARKALVAYAFLAKIRPSFGQFVFAEDYLRKNFSITEQELVAGNKIQLAASLVEQALREAYQADRATLSREIQDYSDQIKAFRYILEQSRLEPIFAPIPFPSPPTPDSLKFPSFPPAVPY